MIDSNRKEFIDELKTMCLKAEEMLDISLQGFAKHSVKLIDKAEKLGKELHYKEVGFAADLVEKAKLLDSEEDKRYLMGLVSVGNHIEMIEDNVLNLLRCIKQKVDDSLLFSEKAVDELDFLFASTRDILKSTGDALVTENKTIIKHILDSEASLSQKADDFEVGHEERLISGVCTPKASSLYLDMVNSIKEINWHVKQVLERIFADIK